MFADLAALGGMFFAAFVAATPIPMQSELAFLALAAGGWPLVSLVAVASVGNTLGSVLTYFAGRGLGDAGLWRWFRMPPEKLARAESWFARWGRWSLLLSWAPGGDVLVILAGALRMPFWIFLPLVALAKTGRYIALALVTSAAI